ncbi:MAG: bifunctional DNA primase/polymerase [Nitrososphaera sp.]|nr:bifunctional DNA primase/polymerase [Nitrososphaera sp.]
MSNSTLNETKSQKILKAARWFLKQGMAVHPIIPWNPASPKDDKSNGKRPALPGWSTLQFPTDEDLVKWFSSDRASLGIRTGAISKLFVLDVDVKTGGLASLKALEESFGCLTDTLKVVTPSGGYHFYFALPDTLTVKTCSGQLGPGIDLRGEGGQVVAPPSTIGGVAYRFEGGEPWETGSIKINYPPNALVELIIGISGGGGSYPPIDSNIEIGEGIRDATLCSYTGILKDRGLRPDEIYKRLIEINNSRCKPKLPESAIAAKVKQSLKWDPPAHVKIAKENNMPSLWRNKQGVADGSMSNLEIILNYDHRCKGVFRYNELYQSIFIVGEPPHPPWIDEPTNRKITDLDILLVKSWLINRQTGSGHRIAEPHKHLVDDAITRTAQKFKYHPIRDWLSSLTWDGTKRIRNFCHDVFGVENNLYHQTVGEILLYGSTARVLYPGCKFDFMPIIIGSQGTLKSTFINELFDPSERWAGPLDAKSKEIGLQTRGKWALEDGELVGMKQHGASFYKRWISDIVDVYRPPYEKNYREVPKAYIVIGTTNDKECLSDLTGGRRYLPIHCGNNRINIDYVKQFREQLFAEARTAVMQLNRESIGKLWTNFSPEVQEAMEEVQERSRIKELIEEVIIKFLAGFDAKTQKDRFTTLEIVEGCIKSSTINGSFTLKMSDFNSNKVGAIMRKLGWENYRTMTGRGWRRSPKVPGQPKGELINFPTKESKESEDPSIDKESPD